MGTPQTVALPLGQNPSPAPAPPAVQAPAKSSAVSVPHHAADMKAGTFSGAPMASSVEESLLATGKNAPFADVLPPI
ncbi:MAG TPA: hypothetical protein VKU01_09845 [Bryobacteraceae bacterium]|nr:hypothetical protein [Bryobacteraceae bacterium]